MATAAVGGGGPGGGGGGVGLASHPLYYYSTHNALRAAEGAENFFPVTFVELHGKRTCKINVYPFCDVQMVKRILLKKMNLSSCMKVRDIRLLYKGSELPNWRLMNIFTDAPLKKLHWSIRSDHMRASIRPLVSQQKLHRSLIQVIEEVKLGFRRNVAPKLTMDGTGGTYILFDARRRPVGIFKPEDEEAFAPCNPRGYEGRIGQAGFRGGVLSGEGAGREYAAHILDALYHSPAGIPPTTMVEACHPAFCYKSPVQLGTTGDHLMMNSYMAASPENPTAATATEAPHLKWKAGSLQQFAQAKESCGDYNPLLFSVSDVHRIAIFDIRVMNLDRNDGNILVAPLHTFQDITAALNRAEATASQEGSGRLAQHQQKMIARQLATKLVRSVSSIGCMGRSTGSDRAAAQAAAEAAQAAQSLVTPDGQQTKFRLVPIDHGLILPDVIDVATVDLVWFEWPHCKMPFSEHDLELIYSFNAERDAERLRRRLLMRDDCLRTLRLSTRFLQQCVRHHLNLHQIATIAARADVDQPSALELLVRTSLQRAYLTMDCASLVSTNRLGFGMLDLAELRLLDENILAALQREGKASPNSSRQFSFSAARFSSRDSALGAEGPAAHPPLLVARGCCACCCRHRLPSAAASASSSASLEGCTQRLPVSASEPVLSYRGERGYEEGRLTGAGPGARTQTVTLRSDCTDCRSSASDAENSAAWANWARGDSGREPGRSTRGESSDCSWPRLSSIAEGIVAPSTSATLEGRRRGEAAFDSNPVLRSSCTTSFSSLRGTCRSSSSSYGGYEPSATCDCSLDDQVARDARRTTVKRPDTAARTSGGESEGHGGREREGEGEAALTPPRRAQRREARPAASAAVPQAGATLSQGESDDVSSCFSESEEDRRGGRAHRAQRRNGAPRADSFSSEDDSETSSGSTPSRVGGASEATPSSSDDLDTAEDSSGSGYESGAETDSAGKRRDEGEGTLSAPAHHQALRSLPSAAFFEYPPSMIEAAACAREERRRRKRRFKRTAERGEERAKDSHRRRKRKDGHREVGAGSKNKKDATGNADTPKAEENVFDAVRGTQRGTVRRLNGTAAGSAYRRRKQQPHGVGSTWLLYDADGRSIPLDWAEPRFDRLFFECFEELLRKYILQQHPAWASYPYKGSRLEVQMKRERKSIDNQTRQQIEAALAAVNSQGAGLVPDAAGETATGCCCEHGYHHCDAGGQAPKPPPEERE